MAIRTYERKSEYEEAVYVIFSNDCIAVGGL